MLPSITLTFLRTKLPDLIQVYLGKWDLEANLRNKLLLTTLSFHTGVFLIQTHPVNSWHYKFFFIHKT